MGAGVSERYAIRVAALSRSLGSGPRASEGRGIARAGVDWRRCQDGLGRRRTVCGRERELGLCVSACDCVCFLWTGCWAREVLWWCEDVFEEEVHIKFTSGLGVDHLVNCGIGIMDMKLRPFFLFSLSSLHYLSHLLD